MLIFFDTEFTDLSPESRFISIGLVTEDGKHTFYVELADTYELKDVGEFARLAVLPQLEGGSALMRFVELTACLGAWITSFGRPVQLATDSLAWDWPWIHKIFAAPGTWPQNLDRKAIPLLTINYLNDFDAFTEAVEQAFATLRRHHALDDAKANRLGWIAAGGHVEYD